MQHARHARKQFLFAMLIAAWLVAALPAPAAGIQPTGRPAVTLTLPQSERRRFDAPSCRMEERLFADAADGRLDQFSPLQAALVAGGVEDDVGLRRYQQKAAALADQLRRSGALPDQPRERAEAILRFLHQRVLYNGYDLAYTDLRRVLDDGRFNCVSGTVLFNYLAGELGLECRGLEMPGHAMSRVVLAKGAVDVETTCPRWFQLQGDPQRQAAVVSQTIGAPAAADRSKAREVSPIQLAAMIYYNRGVDLLAEKRFAEAARANAKALRLDPHNATARGNLLATINNWSIDLGNRRQFAEAVDLLRQGLAMDAQFAAFAQNFVHVHRQWVEHLCGEGRFAEAIEILVRASAEMPDRDYLRTAQSEVHQRWAKAIAAASAD
jgi:tetratricopeptide (TPR) repeat protein